MQGRLYMVPVTLGNPDHTLVIPGEVRRITTSLRLFAVEDIRSARRYLRSLDREFPVDETLFFEIGKHSPPGNLQAFITKIVNGADGGVMSEAGMPGLADPGNVVVAEAHRRGIMVVPLAGPSSIIMALVASGLNGQSFAFRGYLPVERSSKEKAIKEMEKTSATGQTQIFMETPFRTSRLLDDLLRICKPSSRLCIAADISLSTETIVTKTISQWKAAMPDLNKKLVVFLLMA